MASKLFVVMISLDRSNSNSSVLFSERGDPFKIDFLKKLFFGLNRYNGLEGIIVGSTVGLTELKRYNDLSNRYTFHESL
jgi:hypothetical protein